MHASSYILNLNRKIHDNDSKFIYSKHFSILIVHTSAIY